MKLAMYDGPMTVFVYIQTWPHNVIEYKITWSLPWERMGNGRNANIYLLFI